jgi:hemoglobin
MMVDRRMGRVLSILLAAAPALLAAPSELAAQQEVSSAAPTLYTKLGGYDFIARFVDTAFPRVAGNQQLARLFRGHSHDSQMRQRQLIVDVICKESGGPCIYIGRNMTVVHQGLGITDQDWQTFMSIITGTLQELQVKPDVQQDFVRLFEERFRPTVVVK